MKITNQKFQTFYPNQYSPEEFDKIEDSVLSETEKYNLDQIKAVEKQKS